MSGKFINVFGNPDNLIEEKSEHLSDMTSQDMSMKSLNK